MHPWRGLFAGIAFAVFSVVLVLAIDAAIQTNTDVSTMISGATSTLLPLAFMVALPVAAVGGAVIYSLKSYRSRLVWIVAPCIGAVIALAIWTMFTRSLFGMLLSQYSETNYESLITLCATVAWGATSGLVGWWAAFGLQRSVQF